MTNRQARGVVERTSRAHMQQFVEQADAGAERRANAVRRSRSGSPVSVVPSPAPRVRAASDDKSDQPPSTLVTSPGLRPGQHQSSADVDRLLPHAKSIAGERPKDDGAVAGKFLVRVARQRFGATQLEQDLWRRHRLRMRRPRRVCIDE